MYIVVVRGTLGLPDGGVPPADGGYLAADLDAMRMRHNAIAQGGQAAAADAGDFAHDVLLGTNILEPHLNQFLAIDRWTDKVSMQAFYANPQIQAAFGTLFAGAPQVEYFEAQPRWVNWGNMQSGDAFTPYFFHLVLATQTNSNPAMAKAAHDQVACGGKAQSLAAGDVAHVVYTGLTNAQRFAAVDIWSTSAPIAAVYTDPAFVAAFGQLFTGTVEQPTYQSTNPTAATGWYQY